MSESISKAPRHAVVSRVASAIEGLLDDRGFLTVPFLEVSDAARGAVGAPLVAWSEMLDGWAEARRRVLS